MRGGGQEGEGGGGVRDRGGGEAWKEWALSCRDLGFEVKRGGSSGKFAGAGGAGEAGVAGELARVRGGGGCTVWSSCCPS